MTKFTILFSSLLIGNHHSRTDSTDRWRRRAIESG